MLAAAGPTVDLKENTVGRDIVTVTHNYYQVSSLQAESDPASAAQAAVSRGLRALIDLMHAPEARDAAITFREDFDAARVQIQVLSYYKALHDQLHQLQYECFNRIVIIVVAGRFPLDDLAYYELTHCEDTLKNIVTNVQRIAGEPPRDPLDSTWIQELVQSKAELHRIIENSDFEKLKKIVLSIQRVLALQLSRLNTRLWAIASTLRLAALEKAMGSLYDNLNRPNLDTDKVRQFGEAVIALAPLNARLPALVTEHDTWQQVDDVLRRAAENLDRDLTDLVESWPYVRKMGATLYGEGAEDWATDLRADEANLETSIAAQDPMKIKQYFRRYQSHAGYRFYRVDAELNELCGDLRKIGDPLTAVLRMMQ